MERIDGAEQAGAARIPCRRSGGRSRAALVVALLLVAALAALWLARRPIAGRFIDRELAAAGVPARYRVRDLGLGRQRLTDVVIGDPARPDLVADWIETRLAYGLSGPHLAGVRVGRVRLNARLADGKVSLGAVDRLLPPPSGKPFALPDLDVRVGDARIRLDTPAGLVEVRVAGEGRLSDGFAGRIAAAAPVLAAGDCRAADASAAMRVRIDRSRPHLTGPLRIGRGACDDWSVAALRTDLDVTLGEALDRWRGSARLASGAVAGPGVGAASLGGSVGFAGSANGTRGHADLAAAQVRSEQGAARRVILSGDYEVGRRLTFAGEAGVENAAVAPALLASATGWREAGQGTPAGPLASALAEAVARAGRGFAASLTLAADRDGARVSRLAFTAASGGRARFDGDVLAGADGVRLSGDLATSGGGLPLARVRLDQARPGAPVTGLARVGPYAAGGARLALSPVRFSAFKGATRIDTRAELTGPLGDGRIESVSLPIEARWDGRGRLLVNPGCAPLGWARVAVSGLTLDPARVRLCPTGPALVQFDRGRLSGGARIAGAALTGRIGSTPLRLAAAVATLRLADSGFALDRVAAILGAPGRETRIEAASLTGRVENGRVAGVFADAGGQVANVPLLLSAGEGRWTLADGALDLAGALTVSDVQTAAPRFRPVAARDVAFRLAGNRIAATGALHEPTTGRQVAGVRIGHALSASTGSADIDAPRIAFGDGFQPDLLTPLTFGVVADVRGVVRGRGRIDWGDRVTSTGEVSTDALDLAAAFGPATGIATTIRFDDLLALHTPPGQVATVKSVNPGIAVEDGVLRYQLLGDARVQVEGARWPFADGALMLDPTLLDFSGETTRRLTFRVEGAKAGQFLQQFDFANLNATGTFDGVLPMVFDQSGGRIEDGRLTMREGGGTIAYVGALGQEQLGFWGDLAFQALRSLRYRSFDVRLNGPLAGEMVTDVRFAGVSQGEGARANFLVRRLQRLPFVFNIRIRAPFRGLIDSAQSFYDPRRLIQRNLPALLEEQRRREAQIIQPPASEDRR